MKGKYLQFTLLALMVLAVNILLFQLASNPFVGSNLYVDNSQVVGVVDGQYEGHVFNDNGELVIHKQMDGISSFITFGPGIDRVTTFTPEFDFIPSNFFVSGSNLLAHDVVWTGSINSTHAVVHSEVNMQSMSTSSSVLVPYQLQLRVLEPATDIVDHRLWLEDSVAVGSAVLAPFSVELIVEDSDTLSYFGILIIDTEKEEVTQYFTHTQPGFSTEAHLVQSQEGYVLHTMSYHGGTDNRMINKETFLDRTFEIGASQVSIRSCQFLACDFQIVGGGVSFLRWTEDVDQVVIHLQGGEGTEATYTFKDGSDGYSLSVFDTAIASDLLAVSFWRVNTDSPGGHPYFYLYSRGNPGLDPIEVDANPMGYDRERLMTSFASDGEQLVVISEQRKQGDLEFSVIRYSGFSVPVALQWLKSMGYVLPVMLDAGVMALVYYLLRKRAGEAGGEQLYPDPVGSEDRIGEGS